MASNKNIFITGGASGIGRAIAQRFAREGWTVGLGDIDEQGMADTSEMLPNGARSFPLDVREPEQWERVLNAFVDVAGGRLNVLANNAGVPLGGPLAELTTNEIDRTLSINLNAVIYGARAAYPHLKAAAPDACLVNTCSAAGLHGQPGMSVYCASKFGVRAVTESLDAEWAADGIRVRDVMPSFIDTPLLHGGSHAGDNVPLRQRVQEAGLEFTPVEDVAETFWQAVHGNKVHRPVGKTAKLLAMASRWSPGYIRHRARKLAQAGTRPMG